MLPLPLLVGAPAAALGLAGYYLWWKPNHKPNTAYVPPPATPSGPGPAAPPAAYVDQNPGTPLSRVDPLAPAGGYTPGGYNPWSPSGTMPDYQNPNEPAPDVPYEPPQGPFVDVQPYAPVDDPSSEEEEDAGWFAGTASVGASNLARGKRRRALSKKLLGG